ncbi:MAG: Do family serine endopeptidase [Bacteroidales bacterium]|jgi:Do/DeqQ family serine protease|nr:Do family serine endopeptidase [Bacteroidales bacterium]
MKIKNLIFMLLVAVCGGLVAVFAYTQVVDRQGNVSSVAPSMPYHLTSLDSQNIRDVSYPDLTFAAEKAVHCVVHVKVKSMQDMYASSGNPFFDYFYGYRRQQVPREGFGSGVIISSDGYIVTNNHVINKADDIEVALNDDRVFTAKLIGADPSTDLALLKIDESDLPFLTFGNSETMRVGEWVLAVGNPYNLASTVTAGIVSAKARQLGIIASQMSIESFIQTDAAVNQGNSGGALVNIKGELVGINTAIASQTGDFSGNSFAIPATIVQKVIGDLKEFGYVQRAMLGVGFKPVDDKFAKDKSTKSEGVVVDSVTENGGAAAAGIKEGDVITAINNVPVNSRAELQEQVSKYRPNDQVSVTVIRDQKTQQFTVTLRNIDGDPQILRRDPSTDILGAKFEEVSKKDRQNLGISSGVKVKEVEPKGKLKEMGVRNGFIITAVNDKPVNSPSDIRSIVNSVKPKGRILIDGVYPNGVVEYYVSVK